MPLLDVTDVLSDPDFADVITVTRNTEQVGSGGLNAPVPTIFPNVEAVVVAGGGDKLDRRPEGFRVAGNISVYTQFPLVPGSDDSGADVVEYAGNSYTVISVSDWSRYGAGFVSASCDLIPLSGGLKTP